MAHELGHMYIPTYVHMHVHTLPREQVQMAHELGHLVNYSPAQSTNLVTYSHAQSTNLVTHSPAQSTSPPYARAYAQEAFDSLEVHACA